MSKIKVLFVCIHNSARSQMAETFLNIHGGRCFEAESAGIEPGNLNPVVIEAMKEKGLDISQNKTKSVFDIADTGRAYHYVITVCDESSAERCPVFPGEAKRLHWNFKDPSSFQGEPAEKLQKTREVRDEIERAIQSWIRETQPAQAAAGK